MEEWEEPLHPGSLPRTYPTFPHNATLIAHFFPLGRHKDLKTGKKARSGTFSGLVGQRRRGAPEVQVPLHSREVRGFLQAGLPCGAFRARRTPRPSIVVGASTQSRRSARIGARIGSRLRGCAPGDYDRCMPTTPRPRRRAALAFPLVPVLAVLALTGCGSSSSPGSSADPASVVPASAPLYLGAVVRPSGSLKSDASAVAKTLTHQPDSYARLASALQTPGTPTLTYSHDIAPWLGTNAGIFLSSLSTSSAAASQLQQLLGEALQGGAAASTPSAWPFASGAQGAIVLDTSDSAKAASFISTEAAHAGAHAASYRGVSYEATSSGEAFAIVDRLAVLGTVTALHSVIDTSFGGPALVHAADYSKLLASAPAGALAHVYSNPTVGAAGASASSGASASGRASGAAAGASASSAAGGAASTQGLGGLVGLLGGARTVNLSLVPTSSSIALDVNSLTAGSGKTTGAGGLVGSAAAGAQALGELPGESWLAAGLGDAGATLSGDVRALHGVTALLTSLGGGASGAGAAGQESSSSGFNFKGLLEGILAPLSALSAPGAQSQHDFLSWISSAGLFASGSGIVDLRGGIVLDSTDPALSKAAVAKLGATLEKSGGTVTKISIPGTDAALSARVNGLPIELDIANGVGAGGQTKFVIGLGEASVQDALKPSSTLTTAASTSTAASTLGEGIHPSVLVEFAPLLSLLEGVGLGEDPSISHVLPYLRSLTTLVGGGKPLGGGVERFRLVAGLQSSGG